MLLSRTMICASQLTSSCITTMALLRLPIGAGTRMSSSVLAIIIHKFLHQHQWGPKKHSLITLHLLTSTRSVKETVTKQKATANSRDSQEPSNKSVMRSSEGKRKIESRLGGVPGMQMMSCCISGQTRRLRERGMRERKRSVMKAWRNGGLGSLLNRFEYTRNLLQYQGTRAHDKSCAQIVFLLSFIGSTCVVWSSKSV